MVSDLQSAFAAAGLPITITHTPSDSNDFIGVEFKGTDTNTFDFSTGLGGLPLSLDAQGAVRPPLNTTSSLSLASMRAASTWSARLAPIRSA